jgi:prolipoprotein diacylglyceryltransferase
MSKIHIFSRRKAMIESRTLIELLLWIVFTVVIGAGIIYLLKKFI